MRGRELELDPPLARPALPRLRLRLLGLTDLHANLYPYDYYRDCPDGSVGLARAASLVAEARREAPNCLLFDDGDILQGTPLGDLAAEAMIADPTAVHPVIAAMNTLD
jgi:2',3'-cyclic-nucleotide 2'-phosphodiesterase / 3'-nucleotidase